MAKKARFTRAIYNRAFNREAFIALFTLFFFIGQPGEYFNRHALLPVKIAATKKPA